MRIIAFSDSHGNYNVLCRTAEKHEADGDIFVHLGDGEREFERLKQAFPHKEMHGVCGNCDWVGLSKASDMLRVAGRKIFITHGHIFHVKFNLTELLETARGLKAAIALFGHTHHAMSEYRDGIYLFNPGSISNPKSGRASYGIIDINANGVATNIVRI